MENKTQSKIEELKASIQAADDLYWKFGMSVYTDAEYDSMKERLKALEGNEETSFGTPKVHSEGKVKHPIPMLSMAKVYDFDGLLDWFSRYDFATFNVMPKYDGIALVRYPDGTIATRGDGQYGENVTTSAGRLIRTYDQGYTLYGEAIMPYSRFADVQQFGYKTPRSAVSGIIMSRDPIIQKRGNLKFVPYDLIMEHLPNRPNDDQIVLAIRHVMDRAKDFPLDGIVFRISDEILFNKLGYTKHHWRGQIALKFQEESICPNLERKRNGNRVCNVIYNKSTPQSGD